MPYQSSRSKLMSSQSKRSNKSNKSGINLKRQTTWKDDVKYKEKYDVISKYGIGTG